MYLPATNVLLTRFLATDGVGEVTDFMPVHAGPDRAEMCRHQIVRTARAVRGAVQFRLECHPAFDFARRSHEVTMTERGALFQAEDAMLALLSPTPLKRDNNGTVAEFVLQQGESATFVLRYPEAGASLSLESPIPGPEALRETASFWRVW